MDMGGFTFNRITVPPTGGENCRLVWTDSLGPHSVSFLTHANPLLWKIY